MTESMSAAQGAAPTKTPAPGSFAAWMACVRPKTLGISLAPVAVGLTLSLALAHRLDVPTALATALLAVLMQAISNMENDAGYTRRKAERSSRKGLPRATANGWLTVAAVERMIRFLALLVVADTAYLIWQGGWVMAAISVASIVAAYSYMGGPKPIAYGPLGEAVVFVFFGPVAVAGTVWLQMHVLSPEALLAGASLGAIASGVLAVNNYRDLAHDAEVGRRTLAVLLGKQKMQSVYAFLVSVGFVLTAAIAVLRPALAPVVLVLACLPQAFRLVRELKAKSGLELNGVMFGTIKLELKFTLLFCIGALASWLWWIFAH